jgi:RNA polymerase sigma factor (sigma-70 family)
VARRAAAKSGASGAQLDDVCQIVAERLVSKWDDRHIVLARQRHDTAWLAYVAVMTRNAFLDLLREESRRRQRELKSSQLVDGGPLAVRSGVLRSWQRDPSDVDRYLARQLVIDTVDECLLGRLREIALLVYVDGLSTRQISARLGLSIRTVNADKQAIVERLRATLEG